MVEPVDLSFVAPMADLITSLSAAADERALLAALVARMQLWPPTSADLVLVQEDPDGVPQGPRVAAAWRDGHVLEDSSQLPAPALPADLWTHPATPRLDQGAEQTVVVLPLHNAGHGGWLGALRLVWPASTPLLAREHGKLSLQMAVVAAYLGALRSQQALRATLAERELLHDVARQLGLSTSVEDRLRVLVQPAPARDEAEVVLCAFESAAGKPTAISVISLLPARGRTSTTRIGDRYDLSAIPFADLYTGSPGEPLLISDVTTDPRVDDVARGLYAATGVRATIVLALTLQDRWVGLLNICWPRPVPLGERERRIYQTLARQAALQLENSLISAQQQATLHQVQTQRQLLQTVLDQIPVGVLLLDTQMRPVITNPAAHRLLGPRIYNQTDPPPAGTIPYEVVFPDTDRRVPPDQLVGVRAVVTGQLATDTIDVIGPNRDRTHAEVSAVPMRGDDGSITNVLLVLADITARRRAEADRRQLQDEVIRVQAAALAERSSPIIPISDDILVLPIIGNIDQERGQQVLAAILDGANQRRAKLVILDITGVGTVDTEAAAALTTAARALRLLGVEPVLSGIRPDVAATLVSLGVDLGGIMTCGTLQSSIVHALRRLGRTGLA